MLLQTLIDAASNTAFDSKEANHQVGISATDFST